MWLFLEQVVAIMEENGVVVSDFEFEEEESFSIFVLYSYFVSLLFYNDSFFLTKISFFIFLQLFFSKVRKKNCFSLNLFSSPMHRDRQ
jgi:hypothetical protein